MQPEDVQRAVDSAQKYVDEQMSAADLVAVATVGIDAQRAHRLHGDRAKVAAALGTLALHRRHRDAPPAARPRRPTKPRPRTTRRRAGRRRARHVQQRRPPARAEDARRGAGADRAEEGDPLLQRRHAAQRPGQPGRAALGHQRGGARQRRPSTRSTRAACRRSCPAATPARPAAAARRSSRGAASRSSSRSSPRRRTRSTSLAADTGGRAFTDTNDFGEAFARVQRDMSAYYLLGYSSTNTRRTAASAASRCGSRRDGLRVEARAGYYAERDFAHTVANAIARRSCRSRCSPAVSATDLPVLVDRRLVPARRPIGTTCRSRWRCPDRRCRWPTSKDKVVARRARHGRATSGAAPSAASARRSKLPAGDRRRRSPASRCSISRA